MGKVCAPASGGNAELEGWDLASPGWDLASPGQDLAPGISSWLPLGAPNSPLIWHRVWRSVPEASGSVGLGVGHRPHPPHPLTTTACAPIAASHSHPHLERETPNPPPEARSPRGPCAPSITSLPGRGALWGARPRPYPRASGGLGPFSPRGTSPETPGGTRIWPPELSPGVLVPVRGQLRATCGGTGRAGEDGDAATAPRAGFGRDKAARLAPSPSAGCAANYSP